MESGYFVVWTEKDLHLNKLFFNTELWKEICDKSKHLFITAILPELIGKFYSRLPNRQPLKPVVNNNLCEKESKSKDNEEKLWCFCAQVESGKMIYCDNEECPIQWFHYTCLGISCAPRGKWYCPDCRKLSKFRTKRGKKKKIDALLLLFYVMMCKRKREMIKTYVSVPPSYYVNFFVNGSFHSICVAWYKMYTIV
ncbi:unnamed protein product [Mytilus coruscus]|uniref:PHD-type domain-containing protein n=1 Tax=Mytilus coruscus TaxID=42192 RepID=A0A6J8EUQ5_MYTCO|nr:unnamed protein product [Mytilus coruscus]